MFDLVPFEHRTNDIFDYFDRMMGDSFFGGWDRELAPFRADILDKGDRFVLRADMPGFRKEDISIGVEGDRLTLTAKHKEDVDEEKKNYIRRERRYGALSRSFDLQGIDAAKISASYDDGVLELELPKLAEAKPETRKIEIK